MRMIFAALLGTIALTGCTTATPPPLEEHPVREPTGECDASGVQNHLGHVASSASGAQLLAATGATSLRWVPPRTAVTMDYRHDRLTVSYDDDFVIVRIVCG